MQYPITNTRGQGIGYVENNTYFSERSVRKNQIFLRKQYFGKKFMKKATAIDKAIIDRLLKMGVKETIITICGLEEYSFDMKFSLEWIKKNGVVINYDKRGWRGENLTGWGIQIAFDIYDGLRITKHPEQKTLEKAKELSVGGVDEDVQQNRIPNY